MNDENKKNIKSMVLYGMGVAVLIAAVAGAAFLPEIFLDYKDRRGQSQVEAIEILEIDAGARLELTRDEKLSLMGQGTIYNWIGQPDNTGFAGQVYAWSNQLDTPALRELRKKYASGEIRGVQMYPRDAGRKIGKEELEKIREEMTKLSEFGGFPDSVSKIDFSRPASQMKLVINLDDPPVNFETWNLSLMTTPINSAVPVVDKESYMAISANSVDLTVDKETRRIYAYQFFGILDEGGEISVKTIAVGMAKYWGFDADQVREWRGSADIEIPSEEAAQEMETPETPAEANPGRVDFFKFNNQIGIAILTARNAEQHSVVEVYPIVYGEIGT